MYRPARWNLSRNRDIAWRLLRVVEVRFGECSNSDMGLFADMAQYPDVSDWVRAIGRGEAQFSAYVSDSAGACEAIGRVYEADGCYS